MLEFTRVPLVEKGDVVSSLQMAKLARAWNDRILSGLGDISWRVAYYWLSLFRQIRNPDEWGNLWPPEAEALLLAPIPPDKRIWPFAGPGDPEGINLASTFGSFVFGAEALNLYDEATRLSEPDYGGLYLDFAESPVHAWLIAKQQRGAWDPATGNVDSPAFRAAASHFAIPAHQIWWGGSGMSYGGWRPVPEYLGPCETTYGGWGSDHYPNLVIFFTRLDDGTVRIYPGTCPENPTHVSEVVQTPWAYYVILYSGQVDILPIEEWIEGPYSHGAYPSHAHSDGLQRALDAFAKDFRGQQQAADAESAMRGESPSVETWNTKAFDFQAFLHSQYLLAPQRGNTISGTIIPDYPTAFWHAPSGPNTHSIRSNIPAVWSSGSQTYGYHPDCVFAGFCVAADYLARDVVIKVYDGDTLLAQTSLTPNENGHAETVFILPNLSECPCPASLRAVLPDGADFLGSQGIIGIQCLELMRYKPHSHDLALFLRLATFSDPNPVDGGGRYDDDVSDLVKPYWSLGYIQDSRGLPPNPGFSEINTNAVYDAARRQFLSTCRFLPASSLVGYAVEGGKSVLWFKRRYEYAYDSDFFDGLDPIVRTAPKGGLTNRWVIGFQFKAFHTGQGSIFKPDAYGDQFHLADRAHFFHVDLPDAFRFQWLRGFDPMGGLPAEAPTGDRYVSETNYIPCSEQDELCKSFRRRFYKSCQIYEPDLEIEKIENSNEGGDAIVKVTLVGRLHHHEDAPSAISRDTATWNKQALLDEVVGDEGYRTIENGLRDYMLWLHTGRMPPRGAIGDTAAYSALWGQSGQPFGCVWPTFYLVRLVPEPYDDGETDIEKEKQDNVDTPLWHEPVSIAALYTRIGCEGFIDGATTTTYACVRNYFAYFDYTYENLCYDAFGGRWLNLTPTVESELPHRHDNPEGFGPIPNTLLSAELFNQIAACVNKLTRVRVQQLGKLQGKPKIYEGNMAISALGPCGQPPGTAGVAYAVLSQPAVHLVEEGTWSDEFWAETNSEFYLFSADEKWYIGNRQQVLSYRWIFADPDAYLAIPLHWRDQMASETSTSYSFLAKLIYVRSFFVNNIVASSEPIPGKRIDWECGGYYFYGEWSWRNEQSCVWLSTGFVPPPLPRGYIIGTGEIAAYIPINIGLYPILHDTVAFEVPLI